ncbi:hypothetical protein [Polaromonas sp. YR568]|uniref:hypothetical protein n=1 Tax=Polaromonas sp. YR568 TaxID=1855301 RepID=UPI003137FA54
MKFRNTGWAVGMALAILWSVPARSAQAQNTLAGGGADTSAAKPAKKQKSGKSGSVKFLPGSAETRSERATRLKRECKGRVNAGACEGYAS